MAQFKFGIIAPLVQNTFQDASATAYCKRISSLPLVLPDGTERMFNPKTISKWATLHAKGGMDLLIKQQRKDKGCTRALDQDTAVRIFAIKEQFPRLHATQVRFRLIEEGLISSKISVRCVQRFVKDWEYKQKQPIGGKDRKAYEEEYFGAMWQADSSYFPYIPDESGTRRKTYLMLIVDDCTRLVVGAHIYFSDNAENFQATLKSAVATYGIPHKLYCDSGSPYICKQTEFICADVGTILLHAPIRDGAAKGKIERLFKSIKERWLYGFDHNKIKSLDEFNKMLADHIREYNLMKHSSIGETPMNKYIETRGRIKQPLSREWLDDKFMQRLTRRVGGDSTVKLANEQWDAPMQFIGCTVEVRFMPGGEAYIVADGERYYLRKTDKTANARTRRLNMPTIDYSKTGGDDHI
jgi:transposase InsO family protein